LEADRRGEGPSQDVVIAWGDAFFPDPAIFDELLSISMKGSGLIPAVYETDPYVSLLVDKKMRCIAADLLKHGETHPRGLHDQSVFRFRGHCLMRSLRALHCALWKMDRYITPGGELSLLYIFHHLYNSHDPAYVYNTAHQTLSFNTAEEVAEIQRKLNLQWRLRHHRDRQLAPQPITSGSQPGKAPGEEVSGRESYMPSGLSPERDLG
jgi:hypothetical protein